MQYLTDILRLALLLLRKPISFLLVVYILGFFGHYACTQLASSIDAKVLLSLCILPGLSQLELCGKSDIPDQRLPLWANYPKLVDLESKTLEEMMETAMGGRALSLKLKSVEMTMSDLITLTRISDIKSRDLLAEALSSFVNKARKTGRGLTKLTSRIGGTVDE